MGSLRIAALLVALNTGAWILPHEASAQQVSVSFQLFYDELSPYGSWVDYPNYGYVWIPDEDPGFSPYETSGYWVFTDYGWTWVSDYRWGWAAFHYGRWDYDNRYGWFWVPDDEWGPAWVSWRRSPGYYGWAPLRPGISISKAFGGGYQERNERWIFVRDRDFGRANINNYYINRTNNVTIINNSTVIVNTRNDNRRNVTYIAGPDREDVQRVTRAPVTSVVIRENDQPGQRLGNGELHLFRPRVQRRSNAGQNPAPSRVTRLNEVRPASERNAGKRQQNVSPTNNDRKVQQPALRDTRPSNNRGRENQPQTVIPPRKNVESQPSRSKANQQQQEQKKQGDKKKKEEKKKQEEKKKRGQ